jgi:hypothetical protein
MSTRSLSYQFKGDELPPSVINPLPSTMAPVALFGGLWGWSRGYGNQSCLAVYFTYEPAVADGATPLY